MVVTEQGSVVEVQGQEGPASSRRSRHVRVIVMLGVVALVLAGGGVGYARWDADLDARLAAAQDDYAQAQAAVDSAEESGRSALEASAGQVADDPGRQALDELVDPDVTIIELVVGPGLVTTETGSRQDRIAVYAELASATHQRVSDLEQATAAVVEAQAAWELEQAQAGYDHARDELTASIDAGAATLSGSEGKVTDNAVRQSLADAIDAAAALRDISVDPSIDALASATAAAADATRALAAATAATSDAQSAWQAEQDRLAAERAAAEKAAAEQAAAAAAARKGSASSGGSRTSTGSSTNTGGGSSSSAPRLGSNPGSNFGTGVAPQCTTPSCGITF